MKIATHNIEIKNPDKIFFPEKNITKGDLIEYYEDIAEYLLPCLKDRPLMLSRFPDGIEGEGFYQKEVPDYFPDWIEVMQIKKEEGGSIRQVICNDKATLIYLVNQGTVSFHPWQSTTKNLGYPNKLVFDLDPPDGNFDLVIKGAKTLRKLLENELDLNAFVMTTGSQGMHIVSPVKPSCNVDHVHSFAKNAAEYLANQYPDEFTTELQHENRDGRLFLDYLRNSYAQTSIPPYSVRALKDAPVATPLSWDELNKEGLTSQSYHIKNIFKRLAQKDNTWSQFHNKAKNIETAREKMNTIS